MDPSCDPFEVVECDTFITEATFGTPRYVWREGANHGEEIFAWWSKNAQAGRNSILFAYSLGKAQRILALLAPLTDRPIFVHPAIDELNQCYRDEGYTLAPTHDMKLLELMAPALGELILLPPSAEPAKWVAAFQSPFRKAFASGWMVAGRSTHNTSYDEGFVLSDHADWNDLNRTIAQTRARRVFALHRSSGTLIRSLRRKGVDAHPATALIAENYERLTPQNLSLFDAYV